MAFVLEDAPGAPAQAPAGRFLVEPEAPAANQGDPRLRELKNAGLGALKGAADIGATLLQPLDMVKDAIAGRASQPGGKPQTSNEERRAALHDFFREHADPESIAFKGGELGADIAGTAGVGGALAKVARAVPALTQYAPKLAAALESGGFRLGGAPAVTTTEKVANAATRVGSAAAVGGASAGLVDPADAGAGAAIGGALPGAAKVAGAAGKALAGSVSPEVAALYQKAKNLGIEVPADRIVNSKPLNAVAASLNYVPFSGRTATEEKMVSQVNRALSRTVGQDSDNLSGSLRKARIALGDKFDLTLNQNAVKVDNQFLTELAGAVDIANKELGADGAKIIGNQIDEIMSKAGQNGEIDARAAYNIKRTLDRIGDRNSPEAFYARELKRSLMGALNRSLPPDEAAAFATVRKQYGNLLDLDGLAQNGAEGGISIGRLANMKNVHGDLQDIADITAQFVKTRENPHGAAQRVILGTLGAGAGAASGTLPIVAGGIVAGRAANAALNSAPVKSALLNQGAVGSRANSIAANEFFRSLMYNQPTRSSP